jgi:hypothetical protein
MHTYLGMHTAHLATVERRLGKWARLRLHTANDTYSFRLGELSGDSRRHAQTREFHQLVNAAARSTRCQLCSLPASHQNFLNFPPESEIRPHQHLVNCARRNAIAPTASAVQTRNRADDEWPVKLGDIAAFASDLWCSYSTGNARDGGERDSVLQCHGPCQVHSPAGEGAFCTRLTARRRSPRESGDDQG